MNNVFIQSEGHRLDQACSPEQLDKFQRTSRHQGQTRNPEIGQLCTGNRIPTDEHATQRRCYLRVTHHYFIQSEGHRLDQACSHAQPDKFQRTSRHQGQTRNPEIGQLCTGNRIPTDEHATQRRCYLRVTHHYFIQSEGHRLDQACSHAQPDKFQRTSQGQEQTRNPEIGQLCTCNRIPTDEHPTQKRCYLRVTHHYFIQSEGHRLDPACSPAQPGKSQRTSQHQEQTRNPSNLPKEEHTLADYPWQSFQ